MIVSKLQFLNLFSVNETATILAAGDSSPAIRVYLFKLEQAQEIDLCDQTTIDGVNALEVAGVLAVGRANQILNGAVTVTEGLPAGKYRVLTPFNESFPLEYSIVGMVNSLDGTTTYILDQDAGGFDATYLELVI